MWSLELSWHSKALCTETVLASFPGLRPDFISQLWRKIGIFLHHCEIKSGQRPGNEAKTVCWRFKIPRNKGPVKYTTSLVPRLPSEKSRKGLATRMAMWCPRGLYTRANQIAEIRNVTFNRRCANSSVYGDHHGVQLTRLSKFPEAE